MIAHALFQAAQLLIYCVIS